MFSMAVYSIESSRPMRSLGGADDSTNDVRVRSNC